MVYNRQILPSLSQLTTSIHWPCYCTSCLCSFLW
jgi:hypothetical protein